MVDISLQQNVSTRQGSIPQPRLPSWELAERCLTVRLVRHRSDLDVCLPVGEIDLCTAPLLRRALRDTERRLVPRVIVDLARVEFLGLEGIRILVTAEEHARATHRHLGLVVATHAIWRALDLTGVAAGLATYGCLSDALCGLPAGGRDGTGR